MRALVLIACLLLPLSLGLLSGCAYAPPLGYAESAEIVSRRDVLYGKLLQLLPAEQQAVSAARAEARWLADTAYRGAASIARVNEPCLAGWFNNRLVNSSFNLQERGLCWHYQHDLYRELRRRPLAFFRLGCCVRDKGEGSEHHGVYMTGRHGAWPGVIIADAWRYSGRLKVLDEAMIREEDWQDDANCARFLDSVYYEGHRYPIEHWARVKSGLKWNDYTYSWTPEGRASRQGQLMYRAMEEGLRRRGGRPTDYSY